MITHKQLSLADIFTDCQNKFDNDKYFLKIPLTLMKLSPRLLFLISTLPPADLAGIFSFRCSELCYYSLFSRSQQRPF